MGDVTGSENPTGDFAHFREILMKRRQEILDNQKPLSDSMVDTNTRQGDLADQANGNNEVHIHLRLKQTDGRKVIVLLSDGRLDRPGDINPGESVKSTLGSLSLPVHTVALADAPPKDASIRKVLTAGAAVAHQPFSLRVEVGCSPDLSCAKIPVVARELREQGTPTTLATGTADASSGSATLELNVTVERAGKRLGRRVTEIALVFKKVPMPYFQQIEGSDVGANALVIRVQPDEGVTLKFGSKVPGSMMEVREVSMDFLYGEEFTESSPEAYEPLILDVLLGDLTLFPRNAEVEASWRVIDPLERFWAGHPPELYRAGEWGPKKSDEMLAVDGRTWRRP